MSFQAPAPTSLKPLAEESDDLTNGHVQPESKKLQLVTSNGKEKSRQAEDHVSKLSEVSDFAIDGELNLSLDGDGTSNRDQSQKPAGESDQDSDEEDKTGAEFRANDPACAECDDGGVTLSLVLRMYAVHL